MLAVARLFRGALLFFAPLSVTFWVTGPAFPVVSTVEAMLGTFDFGLADSFLSSEVEASDLFVTRGFFLVAISGTFVVGKNRERNRGLNSSEGDGMDGGDAPRGEPPRSLSEFCSCLVGVRVGGLGEEDSTITSAELVIVVRDAFRVGGGQDSRAALETWLNQGVL